MDENIIPDFGHTVNSGWGFSSIETALEIIGEDYPPLDTTWKIDGEIYLLTKDEGKLAFTLLRDV